MYEVLRTHFGEPDRWHETPSFEIIVGAVLVQNTTWTNVERSLESLQDAGALEPAGLLALDDAEPARVLMGLIRPSGFQTAKARTLRGIASWVLETGPGAASFSDAELRASLLALPGIGPETADVIALYVFGRRCFIWDTYSRRMLSALGWEVGSGYESTRQLLTGSVGIDAFTVRELRDFHSLVLLAGKTARQQGGWERVALALPWSGQLRGGSACALLECGASGDAPAEVPDTGP